MPKRKFYILVLASLASLLVFSWGLLDSLSLKENARRQWQATMAEIATADAGQLEAWLATFSNQTQRLASDPRVRHLLASDAANPQMAEILGNAQRALVEFNVLFGAKYLYLFRADNSPALKLDGSPNLAADTMTAMATSFAAQKPTYQPLIKGASISYLGTALPVVLPNGNAPGFVMAIYTLDNALERLGSPAVAAQGATRYILRLDHQGRPQALRWPKDDVPEAALVLSKTPAQLPDEASTFTAPLPAEAPYVDVDGTPVYAWLSTPLVDDHWATLVTVSPTVVYAEVPRQLLFLGLRTMLCLVLLWSFAFGLLWWAKNNPLKGQWQLATQALMVPLQKWLSRFKKPQSEATSAAILHKENEEDMFGHTSGYVPPPPLRLVEWPDNAPPTPERMAHFVRDSLQHERIRLYYQPIVDLQTDKPVMFETLLRLADEKNRMVLPPDFLPAAKQFDLLKDIDDSVLLASIRKHTQLQSHGKMLTLSINLTDTAFRNENFMHQFMEGVASKAINTAYLVFEVSSGGLLQDNTAMTFIREMQSMGCRFAIDYFGGGAKAVAATRMLKFDYMKINALRFADIETNVDTLKTFKEVIDAAKAAHLNVIVEKVETQLMYRLCKKLGVQYAQGFFIAAPAPKFPLS